jgi:5-oxoprolinase (ATP-hydrolysing) subunit A
MRPDHQPQRRPRRKLRRLEHGRRRGTAHVVASANVACGFHAGDPLVMRRTVRQRWPAASASAPIRPSPTCRASAAGHAHPAAELEAMLIYQVGALQAMAAAEGTRVSHVKPHGALNNMACADRALADCVARAVRAGPGADPAGAGAFRAGRRRRAAGLPVVLRGLRRPRLPTTASWCRAASPGRCSTAPRRRSPMCWRMLTSRPSSLAGRRLPTRIESICVHGDGPEAVATARLIRQALEQAGYQLAALDRMG